MKKLFALLLGLSAIVASTANAETTKCKAITKLPFTITTSGVYCLTKNLPFLVSGTPVTSGNAITINADDVVLDLNGHVLSNDAAGNTTTTHGIEAVGRSNVVVKNGIVRGFQYGINIQGGGENNVVDNINADANLIIAIINDASHGIVSHNRVTNTGNSSFASEFAYGICATGDHVRIFDNSISGVSATGSGDALGIGCTTGAPTHAVVRNNMISDVSSPSGVLVVGIYFHGGSNNIATGNQISDIDIGIDYANAGTGTYMNNLVVNAGVSAYSGGTAAGSTNY